MRDAGTVADPSAHQGTGPPDAGRSAELETPAPQRDERERRDDQLREELPQRRVKALHVNEQREYRRRCRKAVLRKLS
jgi:hypothetical protein